MPIYEYRCGTCGEKFEVLVYSDKEKIICEKCGSDKSEKLMSGFASAFGSPGGAGSCGGSGGFT